MTTTVDTAASTAHQASARAESPPSTSPVAPAADGDPAGLLPSVARVAFGLDALGQWRVETRDDHGTLVRDPADDDGGTPPLDLAAYPTGDPAAAVALQQALRARHPHAEVVWRPGVMDTFDETTAAAHRALAAAGADREAARAAAETATASLRAAVRLARDAGLGPVEIAGRTGYARSTITKIFNGLGSGDDESG